MHRLEVTVGVINPRLRVQLDQIQQGFAYLFAQLPKGFNRIELLRLFEGRILVIDNEIGVQLLIADFERRLILVPSFFDDIEHSAGVVVAFQRPRIRIFGGLKQRHPTSPFFGNMIIDILTVHISLSKVASLILKDLAIHRQYLRKEADLGLLHEFIGRVTVDEDSLPGCVGVQVEEAEVFVFVVEVKDHFLYCVDRGVKLRVGVYVASV